MKIMLEIICGASDYDENVLIGDVTWPYRFVVNDTHMSCAFYKLSKCDTPEKVDSYIARMKKWHEENAKVYGLPKDDLLSADFIGYWRNTAVIDDPCDNELVLLQDGTGIMTDRFMNRKLCVSELSWNYTDENLSVTIAGCDKPLFNGIVSFTVDYGGYEDENNGSRFDIFTVICGYQSMYRHTKAVRGDKELRELIKALYRGGEKSR